MNLPLIIIILVRLYINYIILIEMVEVVLKHIEPMKLVEVAWTRFPSNKIFNSPTLIFKLLLIKNSLTDFSP